MSSAAQVLANRENSTHSTGPKTDAGKAASSVNATRHGLTSKHIVIPGEDPAEYDQHRESLLTEYKPAGEAERTLVEDIAASGWRLLRARRFETAVLKKILGDAADQAAAFAEAFLEKPKELDRLQRYVTTIERAYFRAMNKLEKLQKERKETERQEAERQQKSEIYASWVETAGGEKPENGFVSQYANRGNSAVGAAGKVLSAHAAA
jgi:hypothetical protein